MPFCNLTISCSDTKKAKTIANTLSSDYIKTKTSDDVIGIEYTPLDVSLDLVNVGVVSCVDSLSIALSNPFGVTCSANFSSSE